MEFLVDFDTLLLNRAFYNVPLNYRDQPGNIYVSCVTPYGSYYTCASKNDASLLARFDVLKPQCNLPINFIDRRVVSHDFGKQSSWADSSSSLFSYQPPANQKFILLSMRARFPRNVALSEANALQFKLNKFVPQLATVVPVLSFEYHSITDMLKQSDSPINSTSDIIPNLGDTPIVEVEFTYTNIGTPWMSPIQLRGSLNESIRVGTKLNQPLLSTTGTDLTDACWILMAGRLVPDF